MQKRALLGILGGAREDSRLGLHLGHKILALRCPPPALQSGDHCLDPLTPLPQILAFALALAATVAIAACGGDDGGDEDPTRGPRGDLPTTRSRSRAASSTSASTSRPRAATTTAPSRPASAAPSRADGRRRSRASTSTPSSTSTAPSRTSPARAGLTSTGDAAFVNFQDTDYEVPADGFQQFAQQLHPASGSRPRRERRGERQLPLVDRRRPDQLAHRPLQRGRRGRRGHRDGPHQRRGRRPEARRGPPDDRRERPAGRRSRSPPSSSSQLDQLGDVIESAEFDIYTGADDNVLRKFEASLDLNPPAGSPARARPTTSRSTSRSRLSELNEPQEIAAPADAQPLQGLLEQLGVDPSALGAARRRARRRPAAGGGRTARRPAARRGPRAERDRRPTSSACSQAQGADALERVRGAPPIAPARLVRLTAWKRQAQAQAAGDGPSFSPKFFLSPHGWPYLLVPFIPAAIALELTHAAAGLIFFAAALGRDPHRRADGPRDRGGRRQVRARASAGS